MNSARDLPPGAVWGGRTILRRCPLRSGAIQFGLFVYCTVGRRAELEAGMAGHAPGLYPRMLTELADYAGFAEERGYFGFGHPEHHLQIEGFELSGDPALMAMWLGKHTTRMKVITCGFVSHRQQQSPRRGREDRDDGSHARRPLRRRPRARLPVALGGKLQGAAGTTGGGAVDKNSADDDLNREYFAEFVEVVVKALASETFSHEGRFWNFPPKDFVNPHEHPVYANFGRGVDADMRIREIGIAPRPLQAEIPLYGGFSASLRTAKFWARYKGRPIVLSGNTEFLEVLWREWRKEAEAHGHDVPPGREACWGGLMICAETDAKAEALLEDMRWFWRSWAEPFGQGLPELLVGSPDTLNRRIERASRRPCPSTKRSCSSRQASTPPGRSRTR